MEYMLDNDFISSGDCGMNIHELWEYLELQRSLFTDKYVGVIANNNKFYSIEINNGGLWIHYPSWASTINSEMDLSNIKFPVRLHLEKFPPFECLMDLYIATSTDCRLGQWFSNKYVNNAMKISHGLYEETNRKAALQMIYNEYYAV